MVCKMNTNLKHKSASLPELLGRAVKLRRSELGFSQEELAWRAGLNRTYVTDVERGLRNLSLATIDKLARALELPISGLLHQVDSARGEVPAQLAQVEILLVEDNARDLEMTLRALKRAQLANSIDIARDGEAALHYLLAKRGGEAVGKIKPLPQLILLDLKLPQVDGLEVLRRIKANEQTRRVPVVVLTCSEDSQDMAEARRLGADAYIIKPVDFQRLSEVTPGLNFSWALQRPTVAMTE